MGVVSWAPKVDVIYIKQNKLSIFIAGWAKSKQPKKATQQMTNLKYQVVFFVSPTVIAGRRSPLDTLELLADSKIPHSSRVPIWTLGLGLTRRSRRRHCSEVNHGTGLWIKSTKHLKTIFVSYVRIQCASFSIYNFNFANKFM